MPPPMTSLLLLTLGGSLTLWGADAVVLQKRTSPAVVSMPFVRTSLAHSSTQNLRRQSEVVEDTLNNENLVYTATLGLGTPPQTLQVQLDTRSSSLVVETDSSDFCFSDPTVCSSSGAYDANSSSTYQYLDSDFSATYPGGYTASGDDALEILSTGDATLQSFIFGIMYQTTVMQSILGLNYPTGNSQGHLPSALVNQGFTVTRAFSVWLNDDRASSGQILFGGVDTEKHTGNLVAIDLVPVSSNGPIQDFVIPLERITFTNHAGRLLRVSGGKVPRKAGLYTGTANTILPSRVVNSIYSHLNAEIQNGVAYVPCSLAATSISINFYFQGVAIQVPISQYLVQDGTNGDNCRVNLQGVSKQQKVVLGANTLSSMYIVFDMDNNRVALAQTIFNATSSNIVQIMPGPGGIPSGPGA